MGLPAASTGPGLSKASVSSLTDWLANLDRGRLIAVCDEVGDYHPDCSTLSRTSLLSDAVTLRSGAGSETNACKHLQQRQGHAQGRNLDCSIQSCRLTEEPLPSFAPQKQFHGGFLLADQQGRLQGSHAPVLLELL